MSSTTPAPVIDPTRVLHVCDACGQVDDHPRHSFVGGDPTAELKTGTAQDVIAKTVETAPPDQLPRLLAELTDRQTVDLHLDCCRALGCPTGECNVRTEGAEHLRGAELLEHLLAHPTHLEAVEAVRAASTRLDRPAELEG